MWHWCKISRHRLGLSDLGLTESGKTLAACATVYVRMVAGTKIANTCLYANKTRS